MSGRTSCRRNDPRRRAFFDTPGKEEQHPPGTGLRRRRASTKRQPLVQVTDDGLVFKKKSKKKAAAAKPEEKGEEEEEQPQQQQQQQQARTGGKRKKTAKAAEPAAAKPKKAKTAAVPAPDFPRPSDGPLRVDFGGAAEGPTAAAVAAACAEQTAAAAAAYGETHPHMAKAVADVCAEFGRAAAGEGVVAFAAVEPARRENPENARLAGEAVKWEARLAAMREEIEQWKRARAEWDEAVPAAGGGRAFAPAAGGDGDDGAVPAFVGEQDREFLAQSCEGALAAALPPALRDLSVLGDALLSGLKSVARGAADVRARQEAVADRANGVAGRADARALIGEMVRQR